MSIKPYKQSLTHSCLVACFLMLLEKNIKVNFSDKEEQNITLLGSRRIYPFYVVGITTEISKKYGGDIKIIADNKFFTKVLKKSFTKQKTIYVKHEKITAQLIRKILEKHTLICHIDTHGLGDYSHASHFIVIEKNEGENFTITDPWIGKKKRIANKTLESSISELKKHIKMCPLLFYYKKK